MRLPRPVKGRRTGAAASVVSLGLSLALAVVLLAMTLSADPAPPLAPRLVEPAEPLADPSQAPDLAAVFLPPPPHVAPQSAPVSVAPPPVEPPLVLEPPTPKEPPAEVVQAPPPEPPPLKPPIPEPVIEEAAAPVDLRPAPKREPRPAQKSAPKPVEITQEAVREGRALLRLLERGEGPDIEIAWPAAAADRSTLYHLFANCLGMRTVVMSDDGEMFDTHSDGFDADRYSGFVRQPAGRLSAAERRQVEAIRSRHGIRRGRVLRLFPRRVDAILLGALHSIAGADFDQGIRIRARYSAIGNGVKVADIQVDGRATPEIIVLPFTAQRACRTAAAR